MGIFNQDTANSFDALNAPTGGAQKDNVSWAGVNGKVFIERRDLHAFGLKNDTIKSCVGNGTTIGDGDHASTPTRVEVMVYAVTKKIRAVAATCRFNTFSEQGDQIVKGLAGEIAVGIRSAEDVEEDILFPRFSPAARDNLLHENIRRLRRNL